MKGFVIALLLAGAGCLGRYNAPPAPAPSQSAPSASPTPTPTPSPSPTPPETPPQPTPAPASDGGTIPPAPPADGGTTSACAQLGACCQELPPEDQQGCLDQVAGLDEQICQGILDQLQQNGYCL